MEQTALKETASKLVSGAKGILAADESTGTIKKRLAKIELESTPELNRKYRKMLVTTSGIEEFISGIILFDETARQNVEDEISFPEYIEKKGIVPGIKVDEGREPFGDGGEEVTVGLDGLGERLKEYSQMGLKFTKWRAPILISQVYPSNEAILENARRLAEFASVSQKNGFVPIVEPEVLMDGQHTTARCEDITTLTLKKVFEELSQKEVDLSALLLKTNMVLPGKDSGVSASPNEVAGATLRTLRNSVPKEVAGIVFLSGGQSAEDATANLNEISRQKKDAPWPLSFSFARALQHPAIEIWKGEDKNKEAAQNAFYKRTRLNSLAKMGKYDPSLEEDGSSQKPGESDEKSSNDSDNSNGLELLSVGDATLDVFISPTESEAMCSIDEKECLICFTYGDKIPVKHMGFSVGGNAANNAVGASRLGIKSALVLTLGDDDVGDRIVNKIKSEGVDPTYIIQQPATTSNYSTIINYAGERTIFSYHAPRSYEFPVNLPKVPWVYLTSMGDSFAPFYNHIVDWLKANPDIKLAFNPGSRQLRAGVEALKEVLSVTNIIYVNRKEAEGLTGMDDSSGKEKELLKNLTTLGPKMCVVTDGGNGSYVYDGEKFIHAGVLPMDPYERTGAGDAFGSGFIAALIKGKGLDEALLWGTLNSASVIGYSGSQRGLLKKEELPEWLERARTSGIEVKEI